MSYLIDGNNVMAQRVGWHRDKPAARRRLMDELAQFAQVKGLKLEVVFDGAPENHFPDGASYRGFIRVFYAARGSNADERIKQMVEASRERRTLFVVTSDRALAEYVRHCGAQIIRAGDFRRRLDGTNTTDQSPAPTAHDKGAPLPPENTAHWMRYFGVTEEDDE